MAKKSRRWSIVRDLRISVLEAFRLFLDKTRYLRKPEFYTNNIGRLPVTTHRQSVSEVVDTLAMENFII